MGVIVLIGSISAIRNRHSHWLKFKARKFIGSCNREVQGDSGTAGSRYLNEVVRHPLHPISWLCFPLSGPPLEGPQELQQKKSTL